MKSDLGHHLSKVKSYFFVKILEGSMEAEAVDGRLKEAEAKGQLTAVASLVSRHHVQANVSRHYLKTKTSSCTFACRIRGNI